MDSTNTNATVPKAEFGSSFSTNSVLNSFFVENGSYFRMRSLIIGYTCKPSFLTKIRSKGLRAYLQMTNPFTITNYSGIDPEVGGGSNAQFGIDGGRYPNNEKRIIVGLNYSL